MGIQSWSIRKKIKVLTIILIAVGTVIVAGFTMVSLKIDEYNRRATIAAEGTHIIASLEAKFDEMTMGLLKYMAAPTELHWKEKEQADAEADAMLAEVEKLGLPANVLEPVKLLVEKDDTLLAPIEEEIKEKVETDGSVAAMSLYLSKYNPAFVEVEQYFDHSQNMAKEYYVSQRSAADRYLLYSQLGIGAFIMVGVIFISVLLMRMGNSMAQSLEGAIVTLEKESEGTLQSATQVATAAESLSSASTEQAAALQETAASIEEMSAMITKSAENAGKSEQASNVSADSAEKGKSASSEMLSAMTAINESNATIMTAIEASNQRISEINKVIAEIANKTKVINDIVFQTKLLSFNASVEAARAGEHGKGFAVVAEEVGNLAQMSGNAAKEIAAMVSSSIEKVDNIVNETKTSVERLMAEGKAKVASGTSIANQNGTLLQDIAAQANSVKQLIREIATASDEQAKGVTEITKAIGQLDQATQQNSTSSQNIAATAVKLNAQAANVKRVVDSIKGVVWGIGTAGATKAHSSAVETKKREFKPAPKLVPKPVQQSEPKVVARQEPTVAAGARGTLAEEGLPSESDSRFKDV